jgi:hypothetical protein
MRDARTSALLAGLFAATAAEAVDGGIEINPAKALAGGVTSGDTAGFPVTISQAGSYRLTSSLDLTGQPSPENVTAIQVLANRVTIDLNGFAIEGSTSCTGLPDGCTPNAGSGVGIQAEPGAHWTTITNGAIRGLGSTGISLLQYGRIESVTVADNRLAGISALGGALVRGCRAIQNGGAGVSVGSDPVIEGNVVLNNAGSGLVVAGGGALRGNSIAQNKSYGVETGSGTVLLGNAITWNTLPGILAGGLGVGYGENVLDSNNSNGAQVDGSPLELGTNACETDTTCR